MLGILDVVTYKYVNNRRVVAYGVIGDDIFSGPRDGGSQKFNKMFNLHHMLILL